MCGAGRDIEVGVYAGGLELLGLLTGIGAVAEARGAVLKLATAEADEDELESLGELGIVLAVCNGDGAAAEDTEVGEYLRMGDGDGLGLHAAH